MFDKWQQALHVFSLFLWQHCYSASLFADLSTLLHASVCSVNSVTQSCPTLCDPMDCRHTRLHSPSPTPGLGQAHVHWVSDAIQSSHPLLSPSPPALNLPSISVFSSESPLHIRWPRCWSFIFSINPSNEYSGLISFSIDWFDLLAVQGTLKSLLQHHSLKASVLQPSL